MPAEDAAKKASIVETLVEALEIIQYERNSLEEDCPVWVLDPAFDIVGNALQVWRESEDES